MSSSGKPLPHPKPIVPSEKPEQNAEYLGKITLNAAISDKGYVCDAAVVMGVGPKVDEEILTRFKEKKFPPIVQRGDAVPANVIVDVNVWRTREGKIIEFPEPKLPKL
ncbi:MAG: hypothetical protein ACM3JB_21100 [Acidobacteriaceae bacterium]